MKHLTAHSSSELEKLVTEQSSASKTVVLLFTGTKKADGKSWCPDCVVADPVIEHVSKQLSSSDNLTFITVPVGDLSTWKSPDNQYRNSKYGVNCVPTLINITQSQRLEEGGCADQQLVKQLFEGTLQSSTTAKAGTCEGGVCRIR